MKKSVDIINLPIISIYEGTEVGTVKSLIVNAGAKSISALLIEDGKWYMGAKALPYTAITGIGEYAVTIDYADVVKAVPESPELQQHLASAVKIIGSKVLTKNGKIQGKVVDIVIAEDGVIAACEVEDETGDIQSIPAERVLTFAKEVTIVGDGSEAPVRPAVTAPSSAPAQAAPVAEAVPPVAAATQTAPAQQDDSAKKFDEKHRKYLLGKKASRRIETDNGMVIVEQGGEITEEVIQKAKLAGKFVELSMSI